MVMLAALVMRMLVPAGYMVDTASAGPAIVLCSGSGPETAVHGTAGHAHHHHGGPAGEHEVCAYAALGMAAPPPDGTAVPAWTPLVEPGVMADLASSAIRPSPASPPPFATGPPRAA